MKDLKNIGLSTLRQAMYLGLAIVGIATVIAIGGEVLSMITAMRVTLADLLLLFIYLEVLAMVVIYLESGKLPIRIPLYIAIVALARYLILDMKEMDNWRLLIVAGAIMVIALSVVTIRFGQAWFPPHKEEE